MNGGSCDLHAARLCGDKKINIIDCAVGSSHINTGEIFAATETGKRIIVNTDQIKREIFAPIVGVKLFICGSSALASDVPFDPCRDLRLASVRENAETGEDVRCRV